MRTLTLAWLVLTCAATSPLAATEAIQSLAGITDVGAIYDDGAGFAFKPATNLFVNALGYLFTSIPLALDSAVVELLQPRRHHYTHKIIVPSCCVLTAT